jgi:uncharacterized protein involved in outer membrane biogenesis
MRKLLIALLVFLVLLVGALVAVPALFGGRVLDLALEAANEQLEATVDIESAGVSLLRSFPDPCITLRGIRVTGQGAFEGQALADIEQLRLTVGLVSVIRGEPEIRELALVKPSLELRVDSEGRASWDIVPGEDGQPEDEEPSSLSLDLRDIRIEGMNLLYDDAQGYLLADIRGLDHRGDGSVSGDSYRFDNHTSIAALTVRDGAVTWLKDARVQADLPITYDGVTGAVTLGESRIALNELALGFAGSVVPQGEDLLLDLSYHALEASFRSILSLVPGVYTSEFADMQTAGTLSLAGTVKGVLPAEGDDLPGFALEAKVSDASFRMPDLPTGVDDIQLDLYLGHPGGDPDQIQVDLRSFRMAVAGSPITGSLKLRQPVSDPDISAQARGRVDLGKLRQALPLDGVDYSGVLDLDMTVAGRVSDFEAARVNKVQAAGSFSLQDAVYRDAELPVPVSVARFSGSLTPRSAEIRELSMTMGESDLSGSGQLDNLVPWFFGDAPLEGRLSLISRRFDTNPWLQDEGEEAAGEGEESSLVAVPRDLDLAVDARFDTVLYEDLELTDLVGSLRLHDGAARIDTLDFTMLGGRVGMSGAYVAPTDQRADVELRVDMVDFEVGRVAAAFETLRLIAPVAEHATGRFSTDFELATTLGADLTPDLPSLISAGLLSSRSLVLQPAFMEQVGSKLGNDKYASLDLSRGELGFRIRNGRATLQPMAVKVGGADGSISGSTGVLDKSLDLVLDLKVPTRAIQASGLLEQLGAAKGGKVDVQVRVGGTFDKPTVAVGAPGLVDAVREQVGERVDQAVDALIAEARAAGDKLVAAAEEKKAQLVAAAQTQGERLKEEAARQADKLEENAEGKPLQEAAAREAAKQIKKEARQAANKLVTEAEKKGDALIDTAKAKRDELIASAEAR